MSGIDPPQRSQQPQDRRSIRRPSTDPRSDWQTLVERYRRALFNFSRGRKRSSRFENQIVLRISELRREGPGHIQRNLLAFFGAEPVAIGAKSEHRFDRMPP